MFHTPLITPWEIRYYGKSCESDFHQGSPSWEQNSSSMWTVFSIISFFERGERVFVLKGCHWTKIFNSNSLKIMKPSLSQLWQLKWVLIRGFRDTKSPKWRNLGVRNISKKYVHMLRSGSAIHVLGEIITVSHWIIITSYTTFPDNDLFKSRHLFTCSINHQ